MMILVGVSATLSCRSKSQMFLIVNIFKRFCDAVYPKFQSIGHRRRFGNNELDFDDQQKIINYPFHALFYKNVCTKDKSCTKACTYIVFGWKHKPA